MPIVYRLALLPAMFILILGATAHADQYQWGTLPIGGGGYVTGIVMHPTTPDRTYIRTDVGGAYRWDPVAGSWVQLLGWLGPSNANLVGVDGMAIDANLPNRIYLALGKDSGSAGGVYRSDDQGTTWQLLMTANFDGNGRDLRWAGECLGVDPNTSSVIYCGTRLNGLWTSSDEGATWAQVTDVPNGYTGTNPTGVRTVVFDAAIKIGSRSSTIYIGVPGSGIYRSTDGGVTFATMPGAPSAPRRMQVVAGWLYVTHSTGVALWSGSAWQDITPSTGLGKDYCALAVDASSYHNVVVSQQAASYFNPMYRSTTAGTSWAQINTSAAPATLHVAVPWWQQNRFSSATACMAFDPFNAGQLFYTDWFGIWRTPSVFATPMDWYTDEPGHEETVVLTLVAPSSGALVYSGMADNFGFASLNTTSYPSTKLYSMAEGFSIATCEQQPANLAVLGASSWAGATLTLATSANGGTTWTTRTLPSGVQLGRIACSSTDPTRLIYIAGGGAVSYSSNSGISWNAASGAPSGAVSLSDIWNKDFAIAADSIDGARFYLFASGELYTSGDGGATWAAANATAIPSQSGFLNVVARPGTSGEVWVSLDGNGLWRTVNGGATFTKLSAFSTATLFSFGAPAPGSSTPTAYCYGTLSSILGLYRSSDLGVTWLRINDNSHQFPSGAKALAGDRNVFGRVYIGSGGCGIFYGQILSSNVSPVIIAQPVPTTVVASQTATFTVTASGTPTPTYQWLKNTSTISGATAAIYTTPPTAPSDNGAVFSCIVTNSAGTITSTSAALTVLSASPGVPPTVVTPASGPSSPVTGTSAGLSVLGGPADNAASFTYTWSVISGPSGGTATFSPNASNAAALTSVTVSRSGTWAIQVIIADPANATTTISGPITLVVDATLTTITLTGPVSVAIGGTAQFIALACDQFAQPITSQPTLSWSATGGTMNASGLFTAASFIGISHITAGASGISGQAAVSVTAAGTSTGAPTTAANPSASASSGGGHSCGSGYGFAVFTLGLVFIGRLRRQRNHS